MSKRCQICEKKPKKATTLIKLRGKYNPTKTRKQYPNLQTVKLENGKKVKACTKCIKTLYKNKS